MLKARTDVGDYVEQDEEIATIETDKVKVQWMVTLYVSVLTDYQRPDRCSCQCSGSRYHQGIPCDRGGYSDRGSGSCQNGAW